MGAPHDDVAFEVDVAMPDWVDVERGYGLDWQAFSDRDWAMFDQLLTLLPGAAGAPYAWYSADEDVERGYLHASVEPPGLHVYGSLDRERLTSWHRAFQEAVEHLPLRPDMAWASRE